MTTTEPAATEAATTAEAPPAEVTEAPATEAQTADPGTEAPAEADDTDDSRTDAQIGREAAKYRVRLRDTETKLTEADKARQAAVDQLTRQRQAIVDSALSAAGLDPALLTAAGHTVADLLDDDGLVDSGKLTEAARDAMARFNVQPRSRGPQPNRQQGQPSLGHGGSTTWGKLLGDAAHGRGTG